MRIPEIRTRLKAMSTRLHELASHYNDMELAGLSREMLELGIELYRRPAFKRAPKKAKRMTKELKEQLKVAAKENPSLPNRDIGRMFGVDGGRVTDAVQGKRR